jgi:indolepyruvate ferredoxin oxidoreductase beta subunit
MGEHNILITSVGGQGGITLAKVLAQAALSQGLNVKVGETLGMAQRGGSVQSHVRIGESVYGSLIPKGKCDVLLSLEPSEAVRVPEYLGPGTRVILSTAPVYPISVMLKEAKYPELPKIISALEKVGCKVYAFDAMALTIDAGAPTSLNIVVLGAYAALNEGILTNESLRKAIGEALSKRFLDANIRAFEKGYMAMNKLM